MQNDFILALITAPDPETARKIATELVGKKLAACVNILPAIRSIYTWQGVVQDEQEVLLLVKTRASLFDEQVVPAVQAIHPYEVPEIIGLPVVLGSQSYLDWWAAETAAGSKTGA
jgi:periplasmic divalent cation tolerance protein